MMIKIYLLIILILLPAISFASKVQIIHTNDLHSYLNGYSPEVGGYYRVKTVIDKLKADALKKGIKSLVLDGGDFGEGSHYFLTNNGIPSFKALGMLGIDAAVIGNHDYMFGGKQLGAQIREVNSKTQFLGANMAQTTSMNLKGLLKASAKFEIDGVNIEVIGLTTNSLHFVYAFSPGIIFPPNPVSRSYSKKAKESGADLIIGLTHLGVDGDKKLIKADPNIDLVIGGHSHTVLEEIEWQKNSAGKNIPIVQAGAQGNFVGSLIIDVNGPNDYTVESYKLHPTDNSVEKNEAVLSYVNEVDKQTKQELGRGRYDEIIGFSEFDLTGYDQSGHTNHQKGCWTRRLGDITREGTGADVGIYLASFAGKTIPAGEITYGNIIENFPHVQEYGQRGWEVMTFEIKGWQLYSFLTAVVNLPASLSQEVAIGGVLKRTYTFPRKIPYLGGRTFFTKLRVGGKRIKFKNKYKIALPYELARVLRGLLSKKVAGYIPVDFERGQYYLWDMAESYIKKRGTLRCGIN